MSDQRPPLPPFTQETALLKVRKAEDAWNTRDPESVALAYTVDNRWRNRSEFLSGRQEIVAFLTRKWQRELDYRLIKELWAYSSDRIAVRFAYEWRDDANNWFRSYGNENWEFNEDGLMTARHASINDLPIAGKDRLYHWPQGRRPDDHPRPVRSWSLNAMILHVLDLGRVTYMEGLATMREVAEARRTGTIADTLLLMEHSPVLTLGRNAHREHILASEHFLAQKGVAIYETNRGGDVTYHGPGQLVGYPIYDLRGKGLPGRRGPHLGPVDFVA